MSENTVVNIAFSSGVESMYMLQMAMERGFKVNLVFINVAGDPGMSIGEIARMQETIKFFRNPELKGRYPGKINDVLYYLRRPHGNIPLNTGYGDQRGLQLISNNMTQQWSTILAMMKVRQSMLSHGNYPTTFIGWAKDDCSDTTLNENDFSAGMYQELLQSPIRVGRMGNSDNLAKPFRAPLWEMTKRQIFNKIDPDIRGNVMPNGQARIYEERRLLVHEPFKEKIEEYKKAGIPVQEDYEFDISEPNNINYLIKRLSGHVWYTDLELPSDARTLITLVQDRPILHERQSWLAEHELCNLKSNLREAVWGFYQAAQKFKWPDPIAQPDGKSYDEEGDEKRFEA